ncbi:unnamed protein product [Auanema sp. JU1783]|nr:unnamed protein product [Auanema sp. JU1783]
MDLQDDPRVERLPVKATIENPLTRYLKWIYGEDQIRRMENTVKNILVKYEGREKLFENVLLNEEDEKKPLLDECLNAFCEVRGVLLLHYPAI